MLSIRLDKELEARLNNLVSKTGRSKSFYAKKALESYIEDVEDYNLAVAALEQDDGTRYSLEEVMKYFNVKPRKRKAKQPFKKALPKKTLPKKTLPRR